ncbi:MAG: DUF3106 domain-containing protein [Brachymonas sp.]|nr:DUF3106 domain-containing protein [Brachymonas sp.]
MRTDSLLVTGLCALALAVPMVWAQQVTADVRGKPLHSAYSVQQTPSSEPHWKDLSTAEQKALKPLASHWDAMGLNQKRKWQSVAKDFDKLPAAQQSKLHNRMTEWVTLSPQQRNVARQNFAQHRELTDGLTPEQRKAQWQAYQALSADENASSLKVLAKPHFQVQRLHRTLSRCCVKSLHQNLALAKFSPKRNPRRPRLQRAKKLLSRRISPIKAQSCLVQAPKPPSLERRFFKPFMALAGIKYARSAI